MIEVFVNEKLALVQRIYPVKKESDQVILLVMVGVFMYQYWRAGNFTHPTLLNMKKVFLIFLYLSALTALSQEDNILKLIRGTGIDKYSDITYKSKSTHPELDDVTNYFFDLRDCKCFEGSPFMVGLKNKKTKNLIVNLQGGGHAGQVF